MAEPRRLEPHQPLDAVGHHSLAAGLEPIAEDEPTQFSCLTKGMTALTRGNHSSPTHFPLEAIGHYAATFAQGFAGAPQIVSSDAVEHGVHSVTGKAMNLVHEIGVLVIDRDAAQFSDHCGPLR